MKKKVITLVILIIGLGLIVLVGCKGLRKETKVVNVRLQWIPQSQFAGYIVALEKGFYEEKGLNVKLHPAGPDLKPAITVANGTDDFGIGVPNQVITARSNNVPLTVIAQFFQDSPNRYILKNKNRIDSLEELRGKKVGLWLGGDEAEFISMLGTAGMTLQDVDVVSQGFSVTPFLQDEYVLSQVTTYNELILVENEYDGDLQILSPKDYNSAILGDMLFTTDRYLKENPETAKKFLEATIEGWKFAIENPEETLDIVLKYNPELSREHQRKMLKAITDVIMTGSTLTKGIGFINNADYVNAERILRESGQIENPVVISKVYTLDVWNKISDEIKRINKGQ